MPTKLKGMTSIEIAIIVGIVLAIAVAAAWYLYTTFAAASDANPMVRIVSAVAYMNGTIRLVVMNSGSPAAFITHASVYGRTYPIREGGVWVPAFGGRVTVHVDTGISMDAGSVVQGKLITREGYVIPFSARVAA